MIRIVSLDGEDPVPVIYEVEDIHDETVVISRRTDPPHHSTMIYMPMVKPLDVAPEHVRHEAEKILRYWREE